MKTIVIFAGLICVFVLFTTTNAQPAGGPILDAVEGEPSIDQLAVESAQPVLSRQKRFTCDLLKSPPACAAHCVALGRWKGGYCSKGTCYCRH